MPGLQRLLCRSVGTAAVRDVRPSSRTLFQRPYFSNLFHYGMDSVPHRTAAAPVIHQLADRTHPEGALGAKRAFIVRQLLNPIRFTRHVHA